MRRLFIAFLLSLGLGSQAWAIDINTATAAELQEFPGVGKSTADKIVAYRDANGPFASCDDLTKVKGIGQGKLKKIKPTCTAGEASASDEASSSDTSKPTPKATAAIPDGAIDINTATATELQEFPGVGKSTAGKIVDYRDANGPFASCDDLTKVKGIGQGKLKKIKPTCVASPQK